jgi:prepilin-type N-terminal cleavage/methylation domain-containing protein
MRAGISSRPLSGRPLCGRHITLHMYRHDRQGFTVIELVFAIALGLVLAGLAIPIGGDALDDMRTRAAARYVAGRIANARFGAINRSRATGLRFLPSSPDYQFGAYVDGNGNGLRSADISAGIDTPLGFARQLGFDFRGVHFGLTLGIPDVDGVRNTAADGVRIGTARIMTTSPDGTATSGTLYVQGARAQYAVRVLGATGRTRVLKYEPGSRSWVSP